MDSNSEPAGLNEPVSARNIQSKPFFMKPLHLLVLLCVIVAVVVGVGWYWVVSQQYVATENAFIEGNLIRLAPQVSGPVATVAVEENAHVEKGDLLVRLDPADYKVALKQTTTRLAAAKAQLEQAKARLSVAHTGVSQAKAQVAVAEARAANAVGDWKRFENVDSRAISQQKVDSAQHRVEQTRAALEAARQGVESAKAKVKAAQAGIAAGEAAIEQAKAGIEQAKLRLSYTKITAPVSGQVAELGVDAGEYVRPGQALLTIVQDKVWVKANFKETQITDMRVGQQVEIEIDAYPNHTFKGHVTGIQHATGAEFALLPTQNATGNFIKIVQRVPVKIVFDDLSDNYLIVPGLSVVPTVRVLSQPPWPW